VETGEAVEDELPEIVPRVQIHSTRIAKAH
jgi:hypothetical protein